MNEIEVRFEKLFSKRGSENVYNVIIRVSYDVNFGFMGSNKRYGR